MPRRTGIVPCRSCKMLARTNLLSPLAWVAACGSASRSRPRHAAAVCSTCAATVYWSRLNDLGSVAAARPFLARVSVSACLRVPALRRYEAAKDFFAENKEVLGFVGYLAFLVLFSVVVNENAHGEDYLRHNQAVRAALSEQEWNFGDLTSV